MCNYHISMQGIISAFLCHANYHFTVNNEGISKNYFFKNWVQTVQNFFFGNDNCLVQDINHFQLIYKISFYRQQRRSSKQECNFSKIRLNFFEKCIFENMASFSCRGCQALLYDNRIILLLIKKEEQAFFLALETDGHTYIRKDLHFFISSYTDSNGIYHPVVA